jgi:TonB family protein
VSLPSFVASMLMTRSVPVIASVVLHASIAVGLVATAAGHARATSNVPVATLDVDVNAIEAPVLAPVDPPAPVAPEKNEALPTHTHPYPVDPSHDAHPHDPSLRHDEAVPPHVDHEDHAQPSAPEAAAAAPALTAEGSAVLPHFTIASGSGAPMGAHVAANADGNGGPGTGAATSSPLPTDADAVVPASSVQVAARLVYSVTAAYPAHARADDVEGDVGVEIVVDREGRVVDARVAHAAGHGFDEAALVAVRSYRFSPAQREGHAVRVRMPWSVQFRLR